VEAHTSEIEEAGGRMLIDFRGQRFTDLSLNAIEIIDRNLFERSCDVRWWATDSALVSAAANPGDVPGLEHASQRLATILRSYVVYLDLWVTDDRGRVIANGRPDRYPGAVGLDVSRSAWFQQAMRTASGDEFAITDIARNPALDDAAVATYATAIRDGGQENGDAIGVLGDHYPLNTRAPDGGTLERGYYVDGDRLVAFALTPGYETYRGLGWYGVIECDLTRRAE